MIFINEWLPNPSGPDREGEWIELVNEGSGTAALSGWHLENSSGKKFFLKHTISRDGYLVLPYSETKLTLKNGGETLVLYRADGERVHRAEYKGSAPEGKSLSRTSSGNFIFAEPTPGAPNRTESMALISKSFPLNISLNKAGFGKFEVIGLAVGVAVFLTAAVFFVLKRNENLSKLLFGGDEAIR